MNPFIGDNFFKQNPSKVLGKQYTKKGRFGSDMIMVEGNFSDIDKIEASPVEVVDIYAHQVFSKETKQEIIDQVFQQEEKENTEKKVTKRRKGKSDEKETENDNEVYSFAEIDQLYNEGITRDEKEAYYFTHPELNYKLLFDKYTNSKEDFIKKSLICWDPELREFVYRYTYQSGNVSKKISDLQREKDRFISSLGEPMWNKQLAMLNDVRPKQKGFVGDEKIVLLPHSNFVKEFQIEELRFGKPQLNGATSLVYAFKRWLSELPPDNFKKSTVREIIEYYLDNKAISIDSKANKAEQVKQEKNAINIRQRTKEEGDELFARFLSDELLPEDQAKLAYMWNQKFNSLAEPDLNKIPVCFKMGKKFKAGPLLLNPTQRRAAAMATEKKSTLLAYGVGVGKTLASIVCFSQAYYNGYANKGCFVVPTNTYDKWVGEIQGYTDSKTGKFMHGALPQMPPVIGLYNLNPNIVREKLKIYTKDEQAKLDSIEEAIHKIKTFKGDIPTDNQTQIINRIYPVNWLGLRAAYGNYLELTSSKRPKTLMEYAAEYLKEEFNYYIYDLGRIKEFADGTIFVITEVGLQRLGLNEGHKDELAGKFYTILSQGESTAGREAGRDIAKLMEKINQTVSSSMKNAKLLVEDFGINWVCFDEAHYYKKIFTYVKGAIKGESIDEETGQKKYKRDKSKYELKSGAFPSSRALSAFVMSHYIQSQNANRNVIQLTATPFTNSPLEVYSMLALTNYHLLEELGLSNMVDFFDTFMRINYDIKYTPQKTVVKDVVLTGYNNLPQLRQIIYSLMDKKDEGANLKRPTKVIWPSIDKGIETTMKMTSEQEELMRNVKSYIQGNSEYEEICSSALKEEIDNIDFDGLGDEDLISEWEKSTSNEYQGDREELTEAKRQQLIEQIKKAKASGIEFSAGDLAEEEAMGVRILKGLAMMRQITLSPYLYYKACRKAGEMASQLPDWLDYVNSSPKFKYTMGCIDSAMRWHKENGTKPGGHVIYMNAGVEYFPLLKEYLVRKLGFKENQVGIVSGGMGKNAKESVKQKFLAGDILVLIGSSTISVGVDLQSNASTLYNLYYDWNPTDAAQIEGRIWRQGNRFAFTRIVYPQCFNSADPVIFEYLNSKTLRINEIWNRSSTMQELDLRDFDPKKLQKELITDPEEKADWEILEESDRIQSDIIFAENRRESLSNAMYSFRTVKDLRPKVIHWMNQLSARKIKITRDEAIANQKERISEIVEKYSDNPDKMASEIEKYKKSRYDYENDPEGKYLPMDYAELGDEKMYADAKKYLELVEEWNYRSESDWGDLYLNRGSIERELQEFRNNYKDMKAAEERIIKPMGLSFETASDPMASFDAMVSDLQKQLTEIEDSRPARVNRIREEMAKRNIVVKTVDDRIREFASFNGKYLEPQLVYTDNKQQEVVPATQLPAAGAQPGKKEKPVTAMPAAPVTKPAIEKKQKTAPAEKPVTPKPVIKTPGEISKENKLVSVKKGPADQKKIIKQQIEALTIALQFAENKSKPVLTREIDALDIALQFAA
jgi:N12 class adenine-specific DNA methylase